MKAYIVERQQLIENIQILRKQAGTTPIWGVLKANGYGIGLLPLARILTEQGINRFCVTELREAQMLREGGFADEQILLLRSTSDPAEINQLLDLHVIMTVGSFETAVAINGVAGARSDVAEVHLKVDTGMGRYGFFPEETEKMISVYQYMKNIAVSGIYTHFNSAYDNAKLTRQQFARFQQTVNNLQAAGYETGTVHCCNSSAFLRFPEMACDGVRLGSALVGRLAFKNNLGLHRIGYMEATVEEIRWLPKGSTCGYSAAWKAKEPTRVATVGVGWYNGFGAERKNDTFRFRDSLLGVLHHLKNMLIRRHILVSINGQKCPVLGHIAMVHTFVDVTDVQCAVGDRVILQVNPLLIKGVKIQYR